MLQFGYEVFPKAHMLNIDPLCSHVQGGALGKPSVQRGSDLPGGLIHWRINNNGLIGRWWNCSWRMWVTGGVPQKGISCHWPTPLCPYFCSGGRWTWALKPWDKTNLSSSMSSSGTYQSDEEVTNVACMRWLCILILWISPCTFVLTFHFEIIRESKEVVKKHMGISTPRPSLLQCQHPTQWWCSQYQRLTLVWATNLSQSLPVVHPLLSDWVLGEGGRGGAYGILSLVNLVKPPL